MNEYFPISPKKCPEARSKAASIQSRAQEEIERGNLIYIGGEILSAGRTFQYYYDDVFDKYWFETIFRKEDGTFEDECKHIFGKEERELKRPR